MIMVIIMIMVIKKDHGNHHDHGDHYDYDDGNIGDGFDYDYWRWSSTGWIFLWRIGWRRFFLSFNIFFHFSGCLNKLLSLCKSFQWLGLQVKTQLLMIMQKIMPMMAIWWYNCIMIDTLFQWWQYDHITALYKYQRKVLTANF